MLLKSTLLLTAAIIGVAPFAGFAPLGGLTVMGQQTVTVVTTAANTDLRLSANGTLSFSAGRQPLETEPFVLVDPSVSFQPVLGIGGALTDASAETFAKL